jgi:hypothetical protein
MIGWTAVIFAIQGWLGETPAQAAAATTPSYLQVGMAAMSLGVVRTSSPYSQQLVTASNALERIFQETRNVMLTDFIQAYMPLFLPPTMNGASSTGPAPPVAA